jgi:hypothetical protein
MDNFDLKQYITEGRLVENTGDIKLDGSVMMGGDWEAGLEDNEIEFVNQNILQQPTISANDFLEAHGQLWTMMKEPGGDSDVIESGLIDHVQMGILSVDDAVQVMAMYWSDEDQPNEDDLESWRSTFERAKGKGINEESDYDDSKFTLTRDQEEIEDNFLSYWKLQQCEEIAPGKWSVLFNYAFDGEGEQPHNIDVEADSYDEAAHKAYVYTLDYLS